MGQVIQLKPRVPKETINEVVKVGGELADLVDSWYRQGRVSWEQARQFRAVMTHQKNQ